MVSSPPMKVPGAKTGADSGLVYTYGPKTT